MIASFTNLPDRGTVRCEIAIRVLITGATGFVVVPNSVLSTDAGVVRVTAPGYKQCQGVNDAPGDGLPLDAVNPGYTLTDLRPDGFEPQVSAMDWTRDGRLVIYLDVERLLATTERLRLESPAEAAAHG